MKNFIKKSIVAFFSLAVVLVGHTSFAASIWNGVSNDCPTITVANYTTQTGYGSPCWTLSSVSANPGDIINVLVYYHNTSSAPATNVRVVLNAPTVSSTSQTFTGQIISDQGVLPFGPATVNVSSAQSLSFNYTRWFPNQSQNSMTFLNGQTGAEVLTSNGLYLGTINAGGSTQGSVGVRFTVGSAAAANCTISNFTANPTSVSAGSPVTLNWNTSNCTSANIAGVGSVATSGSTTVYPSTSTNYTLSASGTSGTPSQSVFVTVNSTNSCAISNFTANPTSVSAGSPVTLSWNLTSGCSGASISGLSSFVGTSGSTTVYPSTSTNYTLTAFGGSNPTQSVFVTVNSSANCTISNFNANPTSITSGNPVTINWSTSNCTSATISGPGLNSNALSGSQVVYPTTSGTYTITAYGSNGSVNQSAFVTVNSFANNCTITTFNANSSTNLYVTSGFPVTIYWSTNNCTGATISGPSFSNGSLNGSQTIYPTTSGTYTITAYNSNGTSVNQTLYIGINSGSSYCSISGLNASNSNVSSGSPVTIYWSTSNCTSATISGPGLNSNALSGSQVVYPTTSGTYTITAYGSNGSPSSQSITVTVNNLVNSNIVTTVATNVTRTTAQLNGLISNGSAGITNTYFEFGPTVSLGYQTPSRSTSGSNFSDTISNLAPGTIYYFRAVGGASRGTIEFFETLGATTSTPSVVQGTTVTTNSPIKLKIENRYESVAVGDVVDYTITYKNIGKSKLTRPILQVVAPKNITLTNASSGTYSPDTNTLTIPLEDLVAGQEGIVYAQGKVESISSNTAQIVTTAILVYTNASGAQENAMAYVLNKPKDGQNNLLGAAALFSGLGNLGLLGWLVLVLVVLAIVLAARSLTNRAKPATTHSSPFNH